MSLVQKWDKYWYINEKRELVIPLVYDEWYVFSKWIAVVKKYWKYWVINKKWEVIMDFIYTYYYYHPSGWISIIKDWIDYKITTI